ncbi:bacterial capsule synthesis protein [Leptospira broomii serovar Hurstbridge str. 5399]|uniref:Bacterial capsule synthesis protein n=2 Tax=Leptospira broomii TaxID=301541 RepID=T0GKD4_9LEPT|nr:bacterial capsule synthesis protein [Leptospira broomii serovar Hurstbridge str. 5399]
MLGCAFILGCASSSKTPASPPPVTSASETSGFADQLRSGFEKLIGQEDDPEVLKVLVGGDVMFNWGIRDTIRAKGELAPVQGLKSIFEEVDLRMLNLETPVVSEKSWDLGKSYVFQAKDKDLDSLSYLGVDLVFLGNNHAMDHGLEGIAETRKFLKNRGISFIGAGKNLDEALGPWSLEKKGTKLLVYSATNVAETRENYASDKPGVLYFEPSVILPSLKKDPPIVPEKFRKKGRKFKKVRAVAPLRRTTILDSGFRIVSLHWGVEYSPLPTKEQRDQARLLLENGVQVIVGHHPHIPQGIEKIGRGLVFYSLGNLIFGSRNTYLNHNLIAILHVKKGKLLRAELVPIFGKFQTTIHQVRPLEGDEAKAFLREIAVLSEDLGTKIRIEGDRGWIDLEDLK